MLKTVIGLFDSRDQAERAVSALRNSGFHEEISIVAADKSQATGQQKSGEMGVNEGSISSGVSTGGVLGGLAGLAAGAGALAIPDRADCSSRSNCGVALRRCDRRNSRRPDRLGHPCRKRQVLRRKSP